MPDKFRNKYRIPSARLQNWDYRWAGAYFITICTQNRKCFFGEIDNGNMKLSPVGIIANIMWHEIKNHAKNIELDAFILVNPMKWVSYKFHNQLIFPIQQ